MDCIVKSIVQGGALPQYSQGLQERQSRNKERGDESGNTTSPTSGDCELQMDLNLHVEQQQQEDNTIIHARAGQLGIENIVGPHAIPGLLRLPFALRMKDLGSLVHNQRLQDISVQSGATILILSGDNMRRNRLAELELWGTLAAIRDARSIIERVIKQTYADAFGVRYVPPALMPLDVVGAPTFWRRRISLFKADLLLGVNDVNIVRWETLTGAWIQVDPFQCDRDEVQLAERSLVAELLEIESRHSGVEGGAGSGWKWWGFLSARCHFTSQGYDVDPHLKVLGGPKPLILKVK
ncbi:hypothetical protein L1987_26894 [Smallanthus sonchifolius]|uniref:Uncharacterized protein n=1 Tax=Smallanthus sonchifolius TaxID=185202 RepID=A0ACB9I9R4_9ASTR|nr:hypothetical protein L1987_26894 [Smallanthus sonchifolius]